MKNSRYIWTGLILVAVLVSGVLLYKKVNPTRKIESNHSQDKAKGPAEAPIQFVEYSDFQCPACKLAEPVIDKIVSDPDFAGKIHFVYRHFPLSGHRWSGISHQAAECASREGKFWEFHRKLYADQEKWAVLENPTETFLRYAKDLEIPLESFGYCLADPEVRQKIMEEKKKGEALQIRSTPTFFINGERLVGSVELAKKGPELIRKFLGLPSAVPMTTAVPSASPFAVPSPESAPS